MNVAIIASSHAARFLEIGIRQNNYFLRLTTCGKFTLCLAMKPLHRCLAYQSSLTIFLILGAPHIESWLSLAL